MNKPLQGQVMWKDIWDCLQELEAVLTVFPVLTHKTLTPLGNQEANAPAQVQTLATNSSTDAAD